MTERMKLVAVQGALALISGALITCGWWIAWQEWVVALLNDHTWEAHVALRSWGMEG